MNWQLVPHSSHESISAVMDHVVRIRPSSVLDVGAGFGKWGYLIRESLDFMHGRLEPEEWQVRIDGVEVFPYTSPIQDWVYDEVIRDSILEIAQRLPRYDLVVLGDVLEHFEKQDGLCLLQGLTERHGNIVISTPLHFFEQEIAGNPYEHHLSHWTISDFARWQFDYDVVSGATIVVALAGQGGVYPSARRKLASEIAYHLPGMAGSGALAHLVKLAIIRLPSGDRLRRLRPWNSR